MKAKIQEGNSHQNAASTIMIVKMDSLRNMSPNHAQQNSPLSFIARFSIVLDSDVALIDIPTLNVEQFVVVNVPNHAVRVPFAQKKLQVALRTTQRFLTNHKKERNRSGYVRIAREEADNSVRNHASHLHQQRSFAGKAGKCNYHTTQRLDCWREACTCWKASHRSSKPGSSTASCLEPPSRL